jgi:hypothetical protein
MRRKNKEKETFGFRLSVPKQTPEIEIPYHADVAEAINTIAKLGNPALLALLLKMVLKDRITDDEIQMICDVYYHD